MYRVNKSSKPRGKSLKLNMEKLDERQKIVLGSSDIGSDNGITCPLW